MIDWTELEKKLAAHEERLKKAPEEDTEEISQEWLAELAKKAFDEAAWVGPMGTPAGRNRWKPGVNAGRNKYR